MKDNQSFDPIVSVVLPTHNRSDLLPAAIQSVLSQTFNSYELIVIDDASTDGTYPLIRDIHHPRLQYTGHSTNRGLAAARNTGISHAKGKYIAFLDDDDEWLATKLAKQVEQLERARRTTALSYCWMDIVHNHQAVTKRCPELRGRVFDQVLESQPVTNASCWLLRKEAVEKIGGFDESLRRGIDGDYLRRLCSVYSIEYVPEVLVRYHTGHHHRRITSDDPAGIRAAIQGERTKLIKFRRELKGYPEKTARIHLKIANHYLQIRDWKNSIRFSLKAIHANPLGLSTYSNVYKSYRKAIHGMNHGKP